MATKEMTFVGLNGCECYTCERVLGNRFFCGYVLVGKKHPWNPQVNVNPAEVDRDVLDRAMVRISRMTSAEEKDICDISYIRFGWVGFDTNHVGCENMTFDDAVRMTEKLAEFLNEHANDEPLDLDTPLYQSHVEYEDESDDESDYDPTDE